MAILVELRNGLKLNAFNHILLAAVIIAVALSSCAGGRTSSRYQLFESPLSRAVAQKTRTAKLYHQLDTILIADAVYLDMDLRSAWVDHTAGAGRLGPEEKSALLHKEEEENARSAVFLVAMYTAEDKWNDLADKNSRWSVFLETGGGGVTRPEQVEKVKPESLRFRDNLPFDPAFRTFYMVRFPRDGAGHPPFALAMSSLLGEIKLSWR